MCLDMMAECCINTRVSDYIVGRREWKEHEE